MNLEEKKLRQLALRKEGWPRTLSELFDRTGLTLDHCAHVCVDNQIKYMDAPEREVASDKINQSIAPAFNQLGIRTYWIVWPDKDMHIPQQVSELEIDHFMKYANLVRDAWPADIDKVIPKNQCSAFAPDEYFARRETASLTTRIIEKDQVDILFMTGFYADACLMQTALDAMWQGYFVVWLMDGSDIVTAAKQDAH